MGIFLLLMGIVMFLFLLLLFWGMAAIINKVGLTVIAPKMGIKNYGLLWIPGVGTWFEAVIVTKMLSKGSGYCFAYFVISFLSRAVPIIMYCLYYELNLPIAFADFAFIWFVVFAALAATFRVCAMKKHHFDLTLSILVNLFIPHFWSYFMFKRVGGKYEVQEV